MLIGVPTETTVGETRVALTPETAKKLIAQGHTIALQAGAGVAASATDAAYASLGVQITDAAGALGCDLVLKVRSPSVTELGMVKPGAALVGMLNPFDAEGLQRLAGAGLTRLWARPRPSHHPHLQQPLGLQVHPGTATPSSPGAAPSRPGARGRGRWSRLREAQA